MFDRYGRLRVVGALASGAAAVAFAAWYAVYVLPIDLRAGKLALTGILTAVDVVFVLLGIVVYQLLKASPERVRAALRLEAMNGNKDAMPLARPLPGAASTPPQDHGTFDATFSTAFQQWRAVVIRMVTALGLAAIGIAGVLQNVDFRHLGDALMCPSGQESYCVRFLAGSMVLSLLAVPFLLGGLSIVVNSFRELSISPLRIQVGAEGLLCQRMTGQSTLIRWSEIRLLEVWRTSGRRRTGWVHYRHYMCFTRSYQIGWVVEEGGAVSDPFMRLAAAVIAHTGLLARTFDDTLFAPDVVRRAKWNERTSGRFDIILVGVAVIIAIVAFLPALPPRDRSGDQAVLVIITAGLMFFVLMSIRAHRLSAREQGGTALVSVASFDESQFVIHPVVTYEMTVGSYPLFVANQVLFALLGLIATAFGAAFFYDEFDRSFLTNNGVPAVPVGPVSTIICIGVIAAGLAIVVGAVRARDTIVLAELDGVRKRWLLGNVFIPWERVERVERARYWGFPGYRVVSSRQRAAIRWPIQPFQPSGKPQEAGAILTTPAQMAEIVAQRSGRAIQVGNSI